MKSYNISIRFCEMRGLFQLQFGAGTVLLCRRHLLNLMMNVYKNEADLFHQALIFSLNDFNYYPENSNKRRYQFDFGMIVVRLSRQELLYLLTLMWKDYAEFLQSVLLCSDESQDSNRYARV